MTIKLTLEEAFSCYMALNKFSPKELKDEFLSYKMGRLEKRTLKPAQLFQSIRLEFIKKHGVLDDTSKTYTVPPNRLDEYNKDLKEKLLTVESSMESDLTFDTTKLSLFKGVGVAPEFFREMGNLIEEDNSV